MSKKKFEEMYDNIQNLINNKYNNIEEKDDVTYGHTYWQAVRNKIVDNFTSVKVWFFIWPFIIGSLFFYYQYNLIHIAINMILVEYIKDPQVLQSVLDLLTKLNESLTNWFTWTVSLVGTIIVVRETFKITKVRELNRGPRESNKDINKIKE